MNWDVWGAPIAVLAIGVVVGLVVALRSTGQGRRDPKAELVAKKDALVDQLRSLRADRAKLSDEEFERRWSVLLDDAAQALRDVEQWTRARRVSGHHDGNPSGWALGSPSGVGGRGHGVLRGTGRDAADGQSRATRRGPR